MILYIHAIQSHKRRTRADHREVTESTSEKINLSANPSYGFTEHNRGQNNRPCSKFSLQDNTDGTIKMNYNPSYEGFDDSNTELEYELIIQPSCSSKSSVVEDQRYAKPESQMVECQEDETDYI